MPRLNVYIPDALMPEVRAMRGHMNLSEICAKALKDSFDRLDVDAVVNPVLDGLDPLVSREERKLVERFGIRHAFVGVPASRSEAPRDTAAVKAAWLLDRTLGDGMELGIGGGSQMWGVVRRLTARPCAVKIVAHGVDALDAVVPSAHPNFLATMAWMLYAPRATVRFAGVASPCPTEEPDAEEAKVEAVVAEVRRAFSHPETTRRVVIGSCSAFDSLSPYARLLGDGTSGFLKQAGTRGSYLGAFFNADGRAFQLPDDRFAAMPGPGELAVRARQGDVVVALVAAGKEKVPVMRLALEAGLCNTLVTDGATARALLR